MVCKSGKDWLMSDWNKTVEVVEGTSVNLVELMQEEGINLDILSGDTNSSQ